MTDVLVHLNDGSTRCGPIWFFRPGQGWFSIVDDEEPSAIALADCVSAVEKDVRTTIDRIEDVDLLKRAREEGWDGGRPTDAQLEALYLEARS